MAKEETQLRGDWNETQIEEFKQWLMDRKMFTKGLANQSADYVREFQNTPRAKRTGFQVNYNKVI